MGSQRPFLSLLAGALLCTAPDPSMGQDEFQRPGTYLGVSGAFGIGLFQDAIENFPAPVAQKKLGNSAGVNVRIGYRLLSWLAMEAQYEWLDRFTFFPNPKTSVVFTPNTLTGNVRLVLPFGQIQPYALAGVGVGVWSAKWNRGTSSGSPSSTGFAYRLGAGVDLYLTENWVLGLEGTGVLNTQSLALGDASNSYEVDGLDYFSFAAGIGYRF